MKDYSYLLPYATPRQADIIQAVIEQGSQVEAAKVLELDPSNITKAIGRARREAAKAGVTPDEDAAGIAPPGYMVKGKSTYYQLQPDGTRVQKGQWVKTQADKEAQYQAMLAAIKSLTDEVIPESPIQAPAGPFLDETLATYPVGDYHLGMLSWGKETGGNWDMKIAEEMMTAAIGHLMASMPNSASALIPFLGDFFHYDSMVPETPTSKNTLDVDTRPQVMIRAGLRIATMMINQALTKHAFVNVIVEIGNHDLLNSVWLSEVLRMRYRDEPRVNIDTSPRHFHYFRFGKVLLGTHHGHGVKMNQLPLIMAADRPEDWGETEYRHWFTGHVHHSKTIHAVAAEDFVGCTVESFRILAPEDAYAANKGYRSVRDMTAILYHQDFGETQRVKFNPKMMEGTK